MAGKVYIETYGCQMNTYDTELVKTILTDANYTISNSVIDANVALLNTCSVRDNANRKVLNRIHELKKQANQELSIGILGCMATNFKTDLLENKKLKIDVIAGPDSYRALPSLIQDTLDSQVSKKPFDVTLSEFETYEAIPPTRQEGANAWVAIMRGCNNFCTFCVVPYTRGRERSRSVESIIDEINQLVDQGFKQVTLLGQNVNSYRYGEDNFQDLLDQITTKTSIQRVRFTSPHPKDFPIDLLHLIKERPAICKQIHVPLQAGNNRVLKKMNRTYTQEAFLDLIGNMRRIIPDVALSTDIILGFPTETYEEFLDTKKVCEAVEFDSAFIFKYSERPNTRAAQKYPDDVTEAEKTKRITQLVAMQKEHTLKQNTRWVGKKQQILIERIKDETLEVIGRNDANVLTHVKVDTPQNFGVGDTIEGTIVKATPHGIKAEG
jgi:tRNA-2-methylthio-N6-dimethylallyladenosine synthase